MTSPNIAELEQDAAVQAARQAARFSLEELIKIGEDLEDLKVQADALNMNLSGVNEQIRELETETLPDGLKNLGIKDLTLSSGAKISLVEVISASITDENREPAHTWLRTNGHGDLIKNNVTVVFGKGEDEVARQLVRHLLALRDKGETKFGDLQQKEAVHPSTLKAFVRQQVQDGSQFPGELFKLYTGQAVKMTR